VTRGLVANVEVTEGVVLVHFPADFVVEDFLIELGLRQPLDAFVVDVVAIQRTHVQDAVFAHVVCVFYPVAETVVERF